MSTSIYTNLNCLDESEDRQDVCKKINEIANIQANGWWLGSEGYC